MNIFDAALFHTATVLSAIFDLRPAVDIIDELNFVFYIFFFYWLKILYNKLNLKKLKIKH